MRGRQTIGLAVIACGLLIAGYVGLVAQSKRRAAANEEYLSAQAGQKAAARAYFLSLTPLDAFEHCRDQWNAQLSWSRYYEPQAVAYAQSGVDAYYLQGVDSQSLRHFRCTAEGEVYRGYRYPRFGMEKLPAEASFDQADTKKIGAALSALALSADFYGA
jgi:hypothetical protein